ncbi:MAG TPA: tyrosine-type recombinase/integrase [Ktedonobacteraceae bacterium]|nr:tyrosine-type recombinase/integrase [Ktedonobacteraceae bacterium]
MQKDTEHEQQPEADKAVSQSHLFGVSTMTADVPDVEESPAPPLPRADGLTDQSSLSACALPYRQELALRGKSNYTITCFLSDLKMFSDFAGPDTPVGRISKEFLVDWLMKLKFGTNGQTPAPKTMARRVTFLKNFFSWLAREGVLREDPSATLTLERPMPPLPELLLDEEIQRLLEKAAEDPRCQTLVYLVLYAGLKKEEVMGLQVHHVDLSDERTPLITVHFAASAGKQHRERRLALPPEFSTIFRRYQELYHVKESVFSCTDRNLNYILARAVQAAGIQKRVTLQLLRDTFAVQQLLSGTSMDALREKLGLSDEAWLESREKYRRLAFPS